MAIGVLLIAAGVAVVLAIASIFDSRLRWKLREWRRWLWR